MEVLVAQSLDAEKSIPYRTVELRGREKEKAVLGVGSRTSEWASCQGN